MACCGMRGSGEQEARVRQGLSFSLAQTGLESGGPLAGCGTSGSLPTPTAALGVASPRGPLGQQLFVELLLGQREPNVPQSLGQRGEPRPSLCSLLILLLWICVLQPCRWRLAGVLMPGRNICVNAIMWEWAPVHLWQPNHTKPALFLGQKWQRGKNLESHAALCVPGPRRSSRKVCVTTKLQPRPRLFHAWRCVCSLTCCHRHPGCAAFWQGEEQEQAMFHRERCLAMEKLCNMTHFV